MMTCETVWYSPWHYRRGDSQRGCNRVRNRTHLSFSGLDPSFVRDFVLILRTEVRGSFCMVWAGPDYDL